MPGQRRIRQVSGAGPRPDLPNEKAVAREQKVKNSLNLFEDSEPGFACQPDRLAAKYLRFTFGNLMSYSFRLDNRPSETSVARFEFRRGVSQMTQNSFDSRQITRRTALGFLGAGAAATLLPSAASGAKNPQFPKHAIIRTILKDLPPEALAGGATLFHEHMSFPPDFLPRFIQYSRETGVQGGGGGRGKGGDKKGGAPAPPPPDPNAKYFMQDLDFMTEEMIAAKKEGVACLVDGGHPDMGRSFDFLRQLSIKSGMPIVAGAGYYNYPFYPPEIKDWSEDQVLEGIMKQVNADPVGVFGEIGSWDEITDVERKVFRAIGRAHLETNMPIFTHTGIPGKSAMEQLDILEKAGVKPNRIVIGHVGNLVDPDVKVQREICKRGAFVGFDRQGGPGDVQQVPMVVKLINEGFADHLMFASDFSNLRETKKQGGAGYAKTVTVWAPKLREAGVKEEVLHQILVDNSRRFLAFVPKKPRKAYKES
jgi:phosphotriesterase-related protein